MIIKYKKGVFKIKAYLSLGIVRSGDGNKVDSEWNVPSLSNLLAQSSDLFSPVEKIKGNGWIFLS